MDNRKLANITADIVAAHFLKTRVAMREVPPLLLAIHEVVTRLSRPASDQKAPTPAISIRASVKPDILTCLECGSKQKLLKRHLASYHKMSPEDYRSKWHLPSDYPMIAPNYVVERRRLAAKYELGKKLGKRPVAGVRTDPDGSE
ncbi:MucR family transcriptional regulator [Sphingomonas crocodyli]|uniref:Transcriptional regulator n=1 Tax=Sphingomonas crocodyli TaxID=1979270 RepID=A0A437LXR1_9SPHN|nr:MucR family transcriptional regulator [Sphingomonas crocodyli]RVT90199.1 transcriptional regulator [Sphingomonas crocodyli]